MSPQTLRTMILTLILMLTSCTSPNSVEYLGFEGCPNTPELRQRLAIAQPEIQIIDVNLMALEVGDARLGWGAPTILIGGKDLFGEPSSDDGSVSCRNWGDGLPSVEEIREQFRNQAH